MGLLRLLLALSVVASHTDATAMLKFVAGRVAVEMFFVISGFYMQMVIASGKYQSTSGFYSSRFLRIFPAYWIVSLIVLLFLNPGWINTVRELGHGPSAFLQITQVSLFFQDIIFYLKSDNGALSFTLDMWSEEPKLFGFLLNGVSWTLPLELYFYVLAPFLARCSNRTLIVIIAISTAARVAWYLAGFGIDPWIYRFFPFEIALFLCGMLAWRLYERIDWNNFNPKTMSRILYGFAIWYIISSRIMPPQTMIFLIGMAFTFIVPFIFRVSRHSKLDRTIGELSYPVYLIHYPVVIYVLPHIGNFLPFGKSNDFIAASAITIPLAFAMWWFVDRPIDKLRHWIATHPRWGKRPQLIS